MNLLSRLVKKDEIKEFIKRGGTVGKNCSFYNANLDYGHSFLIEIGDNVVLSNCTILSHDASTKSFLGYSKVGKVKIGNNVFIGYGAIVLPGLTIGDDCIIGAGSVVTKNVSSGSVVAGNPARTICSIDEYKNKYLELINRKPIFNGKWSNKSEDDKNVMKKLIEDIGFDE